MSKICCRSQEDLSNSLTLSLSLSLTAQRFKWSGSVSPNSLYIKGHKSPLSYQAQQSAKDNTSSLAEVGDLKTGQRA